MEQNFKVLPIYEEPFRRMVIEEYLATGCQKKDLLAKYHIGGKGAIQRWMRLYGYVDRHTRRRERGIFTQPFSKRCSMPSHKLNASQVEDLQRKVQELERQLQDERLRSEAYLRIIEKAEEELKIQIKKKPSTK
jgi:transposase